MTVAPNPSGLNTDYVQAARYYADAPQVETSTHRTWITRAFNFVVTLTQAQAGACLARTEQPDESMLLLPDSGATVRAGRASLDVDSGSLLILPPGPSEVEVKASGRVVHIFSRQCTDLLLAAGNAQAYAPAPDTLAPPQPWPAPPDGFKLRHYRLADHVDSASRNRLFRCTNLMINVLLPRAEARNVRQLSPHSHADFEQGSLALAGKWVHHLRTPWTPDMTNWRDDDHLQVDSPSLVVIPPKVVHTSRNVDDGAAWLIDIFSPPRIDFSLKGMVRNADEYPMPPGTSKGP